MAGEKNQLFKTYSLNGEPETRIEQEFANLYKQIGQIEVKMSLPPAKSWPIKKPLLVKVGADYHWYVRLEDDWYYYGALTKV